MQPLSAFKPSLKRVWQIAVGFFGILFLVGFLFVQTRKPIYSGSISLRGLTAPVCILRDVYGVPHIDAPDERSAYFALGYTIATDRIFQMDVQRRLAKGELSEILGKELIPIDTYYRTVGLRYSVEKFLDSKNQKEKEAYALLGYFLEGVNAFLEEGKLPVEFAILGYKPKKFEPIDTLSVLAFMGFSFQEAVHSDVLFTLLESKLGRNRVSHLFPRYDREAEIEKSNKSRPLSQNQNPQRKTDLAETKESIAFEEQLKTSLDFFSKMSEYSLGMNASNSWLVSGSKMNDGVSVLFNDPHIGHNLPGVWFEAQISYPGFSHYGYYLAISPFPLLGQNDQKAWGLTMLENDDMDLYKEKVSQDGSEYFHNGSWKKIEKRKELFPIKGEKIRELSIRSTIHGPIVSDAITHWKKTPGEELSMYWVGYHETAPTLEVLYKLQQTNGIEQIERNVALLTAPGLNFSVLDKAGNIAWWGVGRVPIRRNGQKGRSVLDGTDPGFDVIGFRDVAANPKDKNPFKGFIATANARPIGFEKTGMDGNWMPIERIKRIQTVFSSQEKFSREDLKKLQTDSKFASKEEFLEVFKPYLQEKEYSILQKWDGQMLADSSPAALFFLIQYCVLKNSIADEMEPELLKHYGRIAEHWNFFRAHLLLNDSPIWDDANTTDAIETKSSIIQKSILEAMDLFKKYKVLGDLFRFELVHPLGRVKPLNLIFNSKNHPSIGGLETVNAQLGNFLEGEFPISITKGPSTRRLVDVKNPDMSLSVLPSGNSGVMGSEFNGNDRDRFLQNAYRPVFYSKEALEPNVKYRLVLEPKPVVAP